MDINQIFKNNQDWISSKLNIDPNFFVNMAKGQSPELLYIGCSDSRVTAESMMGLEPGEVFVHRNVANVVSNLDANLMSVINYAVDHLRVKHLVVCGHYGCGGVQAAMTAADLGIINPWLRNIRDVYRLHKEELDAISNEADRYKRLVELNVQEQCLNALKLPDVQKAYKEGRLAIHSWVFDLGTGSIIDLAFDIKQLFSEIEDIYRID